MKTTSAHTMQAIVPLVLPTQDPSDESDEESETHSLPDVLEGNCKSDVCTSKDNAEGKENIRIPHKLPTIHEGHFKGNHHDISLNNNVLMEDKVVENQVTDLESRIKDAVSINILGNSSSEYIAF